MTIRDKNNNILKPTDIIELKTKSGNKKLKIVSFKNYTINANFINENKSVKLNSKKHRKYISLYNINDTFAKSDNIIAPYINEILDESKQINKDNFRTNSPVISLQEMTNFGINVKGHMTDDEALSYNKHKINRLLKEAKSLTRNFKELKQVAYKINNIVNTLN